jgi:hypothetical protein
MLRARSPLRAGALALTAAALVLVLEPTPVRPASAGSAADGISSADGTPAPVGGSKSKLRRKYRTDFTGVENPLSEGGAWSNNGLDWARVIKADGMAQGTQSGNNGYDDSYATLSGFPPDQIARAVVQIAPGIHPPCTHEVELHLRWSDAPHWAQGYEINLGMGSYMQIVRWNGPIGDFTELASVWLPPANDGDIFRASIVGNVITGYLNGVPLVQATDSTFATGNPGVGFFRRDCGSNQDFTFRNFRARAHRLAP